MKAVACDRANVDMKDLSLFKRNQYYQIYCHDGRRLTQRTAAAIIFKFLDQASEGDYAEFWKTNDTCDIFFKYKGTTRMWSDIQLRKDGTVAFKSPETSQLLNFPSWPEFRWRMREVLCYLVAKSFIPAKDTDSRKQD